MAEIEQFPADKVRRLAVNLPFERLPTCGHDPGHGEFICTKCPEINRLVDDVCQPDRNGVGYDRHHMRGAIEWLMAHGYDLQKTPVKV